MTALVCLALLAALLWQHREVRRLDRRLTLSNRALADANQRMTALMLAIVQAPQDQQDGPSESDIAEAAAEYDCGFIQAPSGELVAVRGSGTC